MAAIRQLSFAGGEIAPSLYARVDLVKYATGLRTCRNFFIMRHGGATNRPGTEFIGEVKNSSNKVRLLPFVFNASQTYALEFGASYIRFIRSAAQITNLALTITAVTKANPGVVTYTGTDPSNAEEVHISGVVGMLELNNRNFKIANVNAGANTFELQDMDSVNFDTSSLTTYASAGTADRIYEISSSYAQGDIATLQKTQSADVVTIVHPTYVPRELSRTAHTSWTIADITFAPSIAAPANPAITGGTGTGQDWIYKITAVKEDSLEESLPSAAVTLSNKGDPTSAAPNVVSYDAVSGAQEYNIYRQKDIPTTTTGDGIYGFVGTAASTTFNDDGTVTPDFTDTPPITRDPFNAANSYPSAVTYYQGRILYANTNDETETVWGSRSGSFKNFTIRSPLQADDAVTFQVPGRLLNEVRHMVDLGKLLVLTTGSEVSIEGDDSGTLIPGEPNPQQRSYNGSFTLEPILVGNTILYVQARGTIIRELFNDVVEGYTGNERTVFSSHLFENFTLVDWAYQRIPHSVVWVVRSDGVLLALTYIREHQMWAWSRHDFQGETVENVIAIPEGTEDAVYLVIKRTINSSTRRYIERLSSRAIDDIVDNIFMDSTLTYDGRNTSATTMTLSGGTNWTSDETLTLTASATQFLSTDVGNAIFMQIKDADGNITDEVRCEITVFTSDTVVSVKPHKTVPAALRTTATADWVDAVDQVTGLWHLEGEKVSVFADGFVVASPNNASYDALSVSSGSVTLDRPYGLIHVGLPYISDLETLDIDVVDGETLADKHKLIGKLTLFVEKSRGMWAGPGPPTDDDDDPLEHLREFKLRDTETYDEPMALSTGTIDVDIKGEWTRHGRIFIRQVDPIPVSVLAAVPAGLVPIRG